MFSSYYDIQNRRPVVNKMQCCRRMQKSYISGARKNTFLCGIFHISMRFAFKKDNTLLKQLPNPIAFEAGQESCCDHNICYMMALYA